MLARLGLSSCRCTSTSTAKPCRHAFHQPELSHRAASSSSAVPHVSKPDPDDRAHRKALQYAAPLWERDWFEPTTARRDLNSWIRRSSIPAPPPPPQTTLKVYPPRPALLVPRLRPKPPEGNTLLFDYLSLRSLRESPLTFEGGPSNYIKHLISAAREAEMPLVQRLILDDISGLMNKEPPSKGWRKVARQADVGMEGDWWQTQGGSEGEAPAFTGRALGEMVDEAAGVVKEPSSVPTDPPAAKAIPAELPAWVDAKRAMQDLLADGPGDRSRPLPAELVASTTDELADVERLGQLWKSFHAATTQDPADDDLSLSPSLSFLLHLSALHRPRAFLSIDPLPEETPPYLALAIKVLQDVLADDPFDTDLADPPAVEGLPHAAKVQFIVLRTAATLALSHKLFPIAHDTLTSINDLRLRHGIARADDEDVALLHYALSLMTETLCDDRQVEFHPRATSPTHPLLLAHSLAVHLLPAWSPLVETDLGKPYVDVETSNLLARVVDEAVARVRWDLVASIWETWGPRRRPGLVAGTSSTTRRGWVLHAHHRKLLRWYAGEAPFSTYGVLGSTRDASGRSIRVGNAERTLDFALGTLRDFSQDRKLWSSSSTEDKAELIELLSSSKVVSTRTRSLARQFYYLFANPGAAGPPFALTSRSLLNLVRISSPPYGEQKPFAESLVRGRVALLSSPASPYATETFDHADLTVLAQCYLLLDDLDSMTQVFRRLLDQKCIPNALDVECVVRAAARRRPSLARWYLQLLYSQGAEITPRILRTTMYETQAQLGRESVGVKRSLEQVVDLAKRFGLPAREVSDLARLATHIGQGDQVEGAESAVREGNAKFDEVSPRVVRRLLREALRKGDWRWAVEVYEAASRPGGGLVDEALFRLVLLQLGDVKREERSEAREWGLRFVDRAVRRRPPMVGRRATYDTVLGFLVKHGQWKGVVEVVRRLEPFGVEPGEEMRRKVVHWARGKGERVEEAGGWVERYCLAEGSGKED